ncbi:MAG TPA: protein-(glutamine-N5) methyltransferase, release factor-specific, partial [Chloroflexota bacterium]|nr:protein-(glutamine-N5) methyltransferase, release factor-specific [Chloroflexota bacterium]
MSHPAAHAGLAVEDAVVPAAAALREAGIAEPRREAQLLLAHVLEADRAYVLAHPGAPLDAVTARRFRALIARRACREPHAY